jgi:hypothetical protein
MAPLDTAHLTVPGPRVTTTAPLVYSGHLHREQHRNLHRAHHSACPLCHSCPRCYGQYLAHCRQSEHTKKHEHHDCELSHSSLQHWKESHHMKNCVCTSCTGGEGEPDAWGDHDPGCVCEKCDPSAHSTAPSSRAPSRFSDALEKLRRVGYKIKPTKKRPAATRPAAPLHFEPGKPSSAPKARVFKLPSKQKHVITSSKERENVSTTSKKHQKGEIRATMIPDPHRSAIGSARSIRSIRSHHSDLRSDAGHSTRTHRSNRSRGYGPGGMFGFGA